MTAPCAPAARRGYAIVADAVFDAGAQPDATCALAVTTILPGFVVSSGTATIVRPLTLLAAAPRRRTVTVSVPADAGRTCPSARSLPYRSCVPANHPGTDGRTHTLHGREDP